jgi:hypothetical protein
MHPVIRAIIFVISTTLNVIHILLRVKLSKKQVEQRQAARQAAAVQ